MLNNAVTHFGLLAPATDSAAWTTFVTVVTQVLLLAWLGFAGIAFLRSPTETVSAANRKAIGSPIFLWLARVFLVRYAILSFIGPLGLYLLGIWVVPQFTSSLYVVASQDQNGGAVFDPAAWGRIAFVLLASIWQMRTSFLSLTVARSQMQVRFGVPPWKSWENSKLDLIGRGGIVLVAILPAILCWLHTSAEFPPTDSAMADFLGSTTWGCIVLVFLIFVTACVLHLTGRFEEIPTPPRAVGPFESVIAAFLRQFGPGYVREPTSPGAKANHLYPAQKRCLIAFAATLLIYGTAFVIVQISRPSYAFFPVLVYILLLLTIVGQVFSALAFWWDYYHVSPILVFAAVTLVADQISGGDFFFATNQDQIELVTWL
jgi:hypothetical protein